MHLDTEPRTSMDGEISHQSHLFLRQIHLPSQKNQLSFRQLTTQSPYSSMLLLGISEHLLHSTILKWTKEL